ncbi:CPBP family intramembrane metalloprotease [Enemella evansiae]|uniref:CPBP family glutamic-type intramembrane protease n=1 Tax=Enemella evansiae TaxID=2016499 RepID=UPI000B97A195|nr:CPBP family glutamic-type intramembrane protease [Enemella evansiae]OYO13770.1 CPBP family intramembrane metalloprotease [Enemella evansiae]
MPSRSLSDAPPRLTGFRIAVAVIGVLGVAASGWVLRLPVTDTRFFPATAVLGLIWLGGALLAVRVGGQRIPLGGRDARALGLGIGAGLALLTLFVLGALIVSRLPLLRDPVLALIGHAGQEALPVAIIATAVNGIAEECYFRGALYQALPARTAILGSTAVYALGAAASGIVLLVLAALLLGLLTALLRHRTGGIAAPVLAHVIWSLGMLLLLPMLLTN